MNSTTPQKMRKSFLVIRKKWVEIFLRWNHSLFYYFVAIYCFLVGCCYYFYVFPSRSFSNPKKSRIQQKTKANKRLNTTTIWMSSMRMKKLFFFINFTKKRFFCICIIDYKKQSIHRFVVFISTLSNLRNLKFFYKQIMFF